MTGDPRDSFFERVVPRESHLLPFEGFIFLCGGTIDATAERPGSVREALCREIARHPRLDERLRIAERFGDWSFGGHYADLLVFEEHLAELSAVIVLILESPGALAELGLFTALPSLREKLVVFISNYHYSQSSFIRLGPIKYLEDAFKNPAECFPWVKSDFGRAVFDVDEVEKSAEELLQAVIDRDKPASGGAQLSTERWLHKALVVCELIGLMSALTIMEIRTYLGRLGFDTHLPELHQLLFILERTGLLIVEARSSQRFYVSATDRDFVRWKTVDGILDRGKFRFGVVNFYGENDKKRFRALQQVRSAAA